MARQCKSKIYANRQRLKDQGNRSPNARGRRVLIQASSCLPLQAYMTKSQGKQEYQLEWLFPPQSQQL